jgi:hypothetical protein
VVLSRIDNKQTKELSQNKDGTITVEIGVSV